MKRSWPVKCVSEIATHSLGKMLDKAKNKGDPKPYLRNFNVRWFDFDLSDLQEMRFQKEEQDRYSVIKGDLVICEGGYPGRAAIWNEDEPVYFQKALHRVRFYEPPRARWLLYYLYFKDLDGSLQSHFNGTGIQHFTGEALAQFRVPIPPLPEQQRIVAILDEAFAGIATAKANAEKNLQNARGIFESHLRTVFGQQGVQEASVPQSGVPRHAEVQRAGSAGIDDKEVAELNAGRVTKTGGRDATLRHMPGELSLSVGMPTTGAKKGWRWAMLTDLARLESGHTPSRKHPEYWGGTVPWIGIQDAREHHGQRIMETLQKTNELGIANSSARVLPKDTICLSRTASVGYVVVMGRPMATSQDFVNWVCSEALNPEFLKYLFLAEKREGLLRYASGSVHQTIYFPEAKAFCICYPTREEQNHIVRQCNAIWEETQRLAGIYEKKVAALGALKKSLLHRAFAGELTASSTTKRVETVA